MTVAEVILAVCLGVQLLMLAAMAVWMVSSEGRFRQFVKDQFSLAGELIGTLKDVTHQISNSDTLNAATKTMIVDRLNRIEMLLETMRTHMIPGSGAAMPPQIVQPIPPGNQINIGKSKIDDLQQGDR